MNPEDGPLLVEVIKYAWTIFPVAIYALWQRVTGVERKAAVLEALHTHDAERRREDRERALADRKEIIDIINRHHQVVMTRLEDIDKRVKNGH